MLSFEKYICDIKKKNINMDAVMVVQDDRVLGLHRFKDDIFHNVFSISKSYTSSAIGIAIEEGLLTLDTKPCDLFSDLLPDNMDEKWSKVRLEDLITMTSGHGAAHMMTSDRAFLRGQTKCYPDPSMKDEWLRFAFSCPMPYEPGTRFQYGNLAPYVAGRMVEKVTGITMLDYVYEKLWKPLSIEKPRWDTDNAGHTFPASDLFLDIVDMIKLGQIYLGKGEFQGIRFLSEEWVDRATSNLFSTNIINPAGYGIDEEQGYGYYFWQNRIEGYRAYGREGQFILVLPEKNAVIATQAMHSDVQQVLDAVWENIYPQL